jgi:hypothetical protein
MVVMGDHQGISDEAAATPPQADGHRVLRWAAGGLAASWGFPIVADSVHADLVLPLVMLLATAALLRIGRTLLDRLVIAGGVLAGLLIAEGVLFSLWPWGIEPVPVAGFTFTLLVAIGLLLHLRTGASPHIPLRTRGTDAIILAAPVTMWVLLRAPIHWTSLDHLLPYLASSHDAIKHFSLFDAIHHVGGYQFFQQKASKPYVAEMQLYPPGSHYLYALMDVFRTSSTDPGDAVAEYTRFYQYEILGVSLIPLALAWSARWVAGPFAVGWQRTLVCSVVAAFGVFGQFSTFFLQGYVAEALGLSLLAIGTAVVVRPSSRLVEQVATACALMIAVSFVYPIFAVELGLIVGCALLAYRTRVKRSPRAVAALALPAILFVAIPFVKAGSTASPQVLLTAGGGFIVFSRPVSVVFGLLAAAAVATAAGRRSIVWGVSVAATVTVSAVAFYTQIVSCLATGSVQYYSAKFTAGALAVALCGFGAVTLFLRRPSPSATGMRAAVVPGTLSILVALTLSHGFPHAASAQNSQTSATQDASPLLRWADARMPPRDGRALVAFSHVARLGDGVPTVLAVSDDREVNFHSTVFLAVLNHDFGLLDTTALDNRGEASLTLTPANHGVDEAFALLAVLDPVAGQPLSEPEAQALQRVEDWVRTRPAGLRIAVRSEAFAGLLRTFAAAEPELRLKVLFLATPVPIN